MKLLFWTGIFEILAKTLDTGPYQIQFTIPSRMNLCVNYIPVRCRTECFYQYAVSFSPMVDSKNIRYKMVKEQTPIIGEVQVFDGFILFLPIKLQEKVCLLQHCRPNYIIIDIIGYNRYTVNLVYLTPNYILIDTLGFSRYLVNLVNLRLIIMISS